MKLKTSHNTFVVIGESGQLFHLPEPMDQDLLSVWHESTPPAPLSGLGEVEITKGPLAPCTMLALADGLVAFRRNHAYLCAVPGVSELRFEPERVGPWEQFSILAMDGLLIRQPARLISDISSVANFGIDFKAASKPSFGQMPVSLEGAIRTDVIDYISLEPYGRFGNNIYQILNACWMAKSLNVSQVLMPHFEFISEGSAFGLNIKFASNFQDFSKSGLRGHLFAPYGFESIFSNIVRNNEIFVQTVDILRYAYKDLIAEGVKRKSIALHFRSGDIFTGSGHPLYVQPPASYYIKCFDHACESDEFDSVELIYEDRKNPAVQIVENVLLERRIDFESYSATIKKDLSRLLSADCIVSSFGTFCEGAAWLSNYLTKFYCFRGGMGREVLHPFSPSWLKDFMLIKNIEFYICDDFELNYINPRSWENTAGQCREIESFAGDFLRIYRYT